MWRKTLRAGKYHRYFDFTLLKSLQNLISLIISCELYSLATLKHTKLLPLENHLRIVALMSDL